METILAWRLYLRRRGVSARRPAGATLCEEIAERMVLGRYGSLGHVRCRVVVGEVGLCTACDLPVAGGPSGTPGPAICPGELVVGGIYGLGEVSGGDGANEVFL